MPTMAHLPENHRAYLSLTKQALSKGELYTIITNKKGQGQGTGSIVAHIPPVPRVEPIIEQLLKIRAKEKGQVKEITLDMANSMKRTIAKKCFPGAIRSPIASQLYKLP